MKTKAISVAGTQRAVTVLVLLVLGALSATAANITFKLEGFDPDPYAVFGRSVLDPGADPISTADDVRVTSPTMDGGRFLMTRLGGDYAGAPLGGGTFYGFCIEPRQFVSPGSTYTHTVLPLFQGTTNIGGMGVAKMEKLKELYGRFLPNFAAPITRDVAGALQIATWEIVREDSGTLDVYGGTIYFFTNGSTNPTNVVALAQTYVQAINGTGPKLYNLRAMNNPGSQDIVIQDITIVPEPASFALIGAGLLALTMLRRRQ